MASLKSEIAQAPPFSSVEEEAILNVMRTSDCLSAPFSRRPVNGGSPRHSTTCCGFCAEPSLKG